VAEEVKAYLAKVQELLLVAERERAAAEAREQEAKIIVAAERRTWRRTVWAAGAVLLVTTAGFAATSWQYLEADSAREDAVQAEWNSHQAERDAKEKLVQSYLNHAHAGRWSGKQGRRFQSLDALAEAAHIARELKLPDERLRDLRNEAIACMALADFQPDKRWLGYPAGSAGLNFDHTLERYVRCDAKGDITVRQVSDDRELLQLPGSGTRSYNLSFSPDGRYLVTSREKVEVWDLTQNGKLLLTLPGGGWPVFSPQSPQLAVSWKSGPTIVFDLPSGRAVRRLPWRTGMGERMAFRPDGRLLAFGNSRQVYILDLETTQVKAVLEHPTRASIVAWHSNGKILAAGCDDQRIHIWDVPSHNKMAIVEGHESPVTQLAFSHDGSLLASGGWDSTVRLWDTASWKEQVRSNSVHSIGFPQLRFRPDDLELAFGSEDDQIVFWKVDSAHEVRTLTSPEARGEGSWSADLRASLQLTLPL
jgi:dipeptidyl aminopeptidase/acylaminoacyl peptidase